MVHKIIAFFILMCVTLYPQSDLLEQKAELVEEIRRIRKEIAEEEKLFENYRREKENIIQYKSEENETLSDDIRRTSAEIRNQRRELSQVENQIAILEKQGQRMSARIREIASELIQAIDQGIPFEKEKRKAILSALIYDIDNTTITANESFSRLFGFLNLELAMAYDSQVIRAHLDIEGSKKDVNLLRIGRVFFAVDDGQGVYLWKNHAGEYFFTEEGLSAFAVREIRNTMEVIQGKRVPDLMLLPFNTAQMQKGRSSRLNGEGY